MVCHLVSIFLLIIGIHSRVSDQKISYDGYSVWKAIPTDEDGLQYFLNLYVNGSIYFKLDFWHPPSKIGHPVDIMVDANSLPLFLFECKMKNINLTSMIENVQKLIDEEEIAEKTNLTFKSFGDDSFDFSKYPTLDEVERYLANLPTKYPNLVESSYMATTHENRPVVLLKITNKFTNDVNKPAIFVNGGIHAREWISPTTVLYTINQLVTNYDADTDIKNYLDNLVWYFVPVLNPDGYVYSHSTDRMWRKNRRPKTCGKNSWGQCCEGVDLNRNFGYHWAESGSSDDSCTEVYHGPNAFSEPETIGMRDFILKNRNSIKACLSLHSYSRVWLYPYGFRFSTYPQDKDDLMNLADRATKALQSVFGTQYMFGSVSDLLYAAAGGSDDWVKGVANIKYVYTLELPPGMGEPGYNNGFVLPPTQIIPVGEETWKAFQVIAEEVISKYSNRNVVQQK